MTRPERRCRWLLRAYPAWYRRDRGDDMLGTLLDGQEPGAGWPAPREALALVAGGLRARSLLNRRLSMAADLRLAALLGLAIVAAARAGQVLGLELAFALHAFPVQAGLSGYQAACGVLLLSAAAACWIPGRAVTITLAVAAAVLYVTAFSGAVVILPAGALIAMALLSLGTEPMPRLWLAAPCAAFIIATARGPSEPGRHSLQVSYRYLHLPAAGNASLDVDVIPHQVVPVSYRAPASVLMGAGRPVSAGLELISSCGQASAASISAWCASTQS